MQVSNTTIDHLRTMMKEMPKADLAVKLEASPDLAQSILERATDPTYGSLSGMKIDVGWKHPLSVRLETNPALAGMTGILHYQSGRKEYI